MIAIKNSRELRAMKEACVVSARAMQLAGKAIEPGVPGRSTGSSATISINDQVIHGIPGKRVIKAGDIVSVDVGACLNGFHGDNAATFAAGEISPDAQALMDATRESLYEGIRAAMAGGRVGDIGAAVQRYVEVRGYSVVRQFVGHGVGTNLHEDPSVPNFGTPGRGPRLLPGMTIAIEPMINAGTHEVKILGDGWTTVTSDGKLSAHFEHTVAINRDGPVNLTVA